MKKIFLTSVLSLTIACPALADIATNNANPTCDNDTIGAYSGSTELEAQWNRNTINLKWYDADVEITTVGNTSKTCLYDGAIVLPSNPTRTGYTFDKWVVRPSGFDMNTLLQYVSEAASSFGCIEFNGSETTNGSSFFGTTKTPASYGLTERGEWATEFSYGYIKGIARCSLIGYGKSRGNHGEPTDDLNTAGAQYCWCKVTGYDAEKDGNYVAPVASLWTFGNDYKSASSCASSCTWSCSQYNKNEEAFREGVYSTEQ